MKISKAGDDARILITQTSSVAALYVHIAHIGQTMLGWRSTLPLPFHFSFPSFRLMPDGVSGFVTGMGTSTSIDEWCYPTLHLIPLSTRALQRVRERMYENDM